jgi:hypothetical protein
LKPNESQKAIIECLEEWQFWVFAGSYSLGAMNLLDP